ncbi:MAG: UDP-N-acetylmuramoyl-L-alanyl-D-glutamate--2,6-diaminopimelate ligase, partial [Desulfamplus sp.]|nr:UDP-N-acetylmuramoyl-L-alanyl-D-glutamate--2,6-diaminopimelate ligase [Desulfamplus sp.]
MKLSYLIKNCSPVWNRIILPSNQDEHNHLLGSIDEHNKQDHYHHQTGDPEITSIHANASEVKAGGLFIAIKGFKADGHDFIDKALANGAVAVITEQKIARKEGANLAHCPIFVEVQDSRKAMSSIAARFYGNPSDSMVLIGITGTNGKTTTAFLIESILKSAGYKTGVIGTVNYRYNNQVFENPVTTPESIDLHKILALMRDAGVTHVVMEVSSHAIDLHRVRDCEFDVGVFTNLTQDHLDYHKTMSAYFSCKKRFFTKQLKRGKKAQKSVAVINVNDEYGQTLAQDFSKDVKDKDVSLNLITVGFQSNNSDIFCSNIKDDISGLKGNLHIGSEIGAKIGSKIGAEIGSVHLIDFKSKLTGNFNLENILCAVGAAHAIGISFEAIKNGVESCEGVPGRLERVQSFDQLEQFDLLDQLNQFNQLKRDDFDRYAFVDYAHTPDALESILKTLKMRAPARLISIFGCGGDRDKTKRPIMGKIAYSYSDIAIITSDNPRSENPDAIIEDIVAGIKYKSVSSKKIVVEPDRAKAIEIAVTLSEPN